MSDKELLALAAKAAGLSLECFHNDVLGWELWNGDCWNPLTDDGDALRLAVKLKLRIDVGCLTIYVDAWKASEKIAEPAGEDAAAAIRRAIVRAAAELGKSK